MEEFAASQNTALAKFVDYPNYTKNDNEALQAIRAVYESLAQHPDIDSKFLEQAAIKGMVKSLDPHTSFITPEQYQEFKIETQGRFGGIGLQIGIKEGRLIAMAPVDGSPADRAGIRPGDYIASINGESSQNLTLIAAVQRLRKVSTC